MYKKLTVLLLSIIFLLLSSCTIGGVNLIDDILVNDTQRAEKTFKQVLEAVEANDKEALKVVFSPKALDETEDMDGDIDTLFEFVQGEVESWEGRIGPVGGPYEHGKMQKRSVYGAKVITDEQEYIFMLIEYPIDTFDTSNVGLYTLFVTKAENEGAYGYWTDHLYPGIELWEPSADGDG